MNVRIFRRGAASAALLILALVTLLSSAALLPPLNSYRVQSLVSSIGGPTALHHEMLFVNGWGLARGPAGPWWVVSNATGVVYRWNGDGDLPHPFIEVTGNPTGQVLNSSTSFVVQRGVVSQPATFLFATENGKIAGWNNNLTPPTPTHTAVVAVDRSSTGTVYKGLAIASVPGGFRLYATDFFHAHVDVWDGSWNPINAPGAFVDPTLPAGYAPFGIQVLGNNVYVSYAKQDAMAHDDQPGPGFGYVSVFDRFGAFLARIASGGTLNAPWGLAIAPPNFSVFSNALLVGNFGDGRINAFDLTTHAFLGQLHDSNNTPIVIDGLWALAFGGGNASGSLRALFFTAGPMGESQGWFGKISPN
jgi:uncharacterized protein (TIGR03118 family)